jgi:hypothetical protein
MTTESRIDALEARLQALVDDLEIRNVLSRYGYYADACLDEEYLALYTDDGAMDLAMAGVYAEARRWEGADGLRDFITDPAGSHRPGYYGHTLHLLSQNVVVTVSGDDAVATGYSIVLRQAETGIETIGAGTNRWTLRREHGAWKISERVRRNVGTPESRELLPR